MDLLIPLALVFTVLAVLAVLHPVVTGRQAVLHRDEEEESEARSRKRTALRALRDVEYDFQTGKMDEEDYARFKSELASEALAAIEEEEARSGAPGTGNGRGGASADDALEAEISRYREALREGSTCPGCGAANESAARFCSSCGIRLGARFCSSCGAARQGDEPACEACGAPLS